MKNSTAIVFAARHTFSPSCSEKRNEISATHMSAMLLRTPWIARLASGMCFSSSFSFSRRAIAACRANAGGGGTRVRPDADIFKTRGGCGARHLAPGELLGNLLAAGHEGLLHSLVDGVDICDVLLRAPEEAQRCQPVPAKPMCRSCQMVLLWVFIHAAHGGYPAPSRRPRTECASRRSRRTRPALRCSR